MDVYRALRHTGGGRWDVRNTECRSAWCGDAGAGRQMDPFGMGLPGNRFPQAGLLGFQEAGFALVCLPMAQPGSVQKEEQSPRWLEMLLGVAPFRRSLPGLGQGGAQVTLRPMVTGPSLTQCLGSNPVLSTCLWGGRAQDGSPEWVVITFTI